MSRRDINAVMEGAGFRIRRDTGPHIVWERDGQVITTAKTASDYRAILNMKAEVRRADKRNGIVKLKPAPQPKVIVRRATLAEGLMQAVAPSPKVPTTKEANAKLAEWSAKGLTYVAMAIELEALGYKSERNGKPLTWASIASRLATMGLSKKKVKKQAERKLKKLAKTIKPVAPMPHKEAQQSARIQSIKYLLQDQTMTAEDRIAMVLLIIG